MIPLMLVVGFRTYKGRGLRLWVPLFLVWLLLLPLVLVLLPLAFLALAFLRVNPLRAVQTGWQLLTGLKGTRIEIQDGNALLLIRFF
ncbi:MAG TPA: hypothetical protein VI636_21850 [Candidatus Angelobacter sp.]